MRDAGLDHDSDDGRISDPSLGSKHERAIDKALILGGSLLLLFSFVWVVWREVLS